jgi:RHS repeat-associated protein
MRNATLLVAIFLTTFASVSSFAMVAMQSDTGSNDQGSSYYSVPIHVPPGSGGLAPQLALTYSSWPGNGDASTRFKDGLKGNTDGNGIAGIGWALSGLSTITRCPRTLATDNYAGTVQLDANDRFCLDGQRLVSVGTGTYGADSTEYRTEVETFTKVVSYGTSGSGPAWFKVWLKSGLIMEFGNTIDSRILAPASLSAVTWAVNKVSDRFTNYYTVSYNATSTGEYLPARIDYTGNVSAGLAPYNSVRFTYEARPDVEQYYVGTTRLQYQNRLTKIDTYDVANVVTTYSLTYDNSSPTGSSRLASVSQCGADGTCLGGLTMSYTAGTGGVVSPNENPVTLNTSFSTPTAKFLTGDFNGDGIQDVLAINSNGYNASACLGPTFTSCTVMSLGSQPGDAIVIDYNGDGFSDIVIQFGTGNIGICPGPQLTCTVFSTSLYNYPPSEFHLVGGNFNGTGLETFLILDDQSYRPWVCDPNTMLAYPGSNNCNWGAVLAGLPAGFTPITGDFDGDGRTDLMLVGPSSYQFCPAMMYCTSIATTFNWRDNAQIITGDFNGDGRSDLILLGRYDGVISCPGPGVASSISGCAQISTENWMDSWHAYAGDFRVHGKSDVVLVGSSLMFCPSLHTSPSCYMVNPGGGNAVIGVGDFNGDGSADLLAQSGTSLILGPGAPARPDMLSSVTTGQLNTTTTFAYKPLSDTSVHTKGNTAAYPLQETAKPLYVVSQITQPNGVGGSNATTYRYEHARIDLKGRTFVGFEVSHSLDVTANREVVTKRLQTYPSQGVITERDVITAGSLAAKSLRTITTGQTFEQRPVSNLTSEVSFSYGLDGKWSSNRENYTYDGYGNVIWVDSYVDGEAATTQMKGISSRGLSYDVPNWLLGQKTGLTDIFYDSNMQETRQVRGYVPVPGTLATQQTTDDPGQSNSVVTDYARDAFGNVTSKTVTGNGMAARTTTWFYDTRGQFVTSKEDALGYYTNYTTDSRFGTTLTSIDPNRLVTSWQYDSLGRVKLESRPDGTSTSWAYYAARYPSYAANPNIAWYTTANITGYDFPFVTYYDELNRHILSTKRNFADNGLVDTFNVWYDANGRIVRTYDPYDRGGTMHYTLKQYNTMGQLASVTAPDGGVTQYAYAASLNSGPVYTSMTDPRNNTTTYARTVNGDLIYVRDPLLYATSYQVNALHKISSITDPNGNVLTLTYDNRGRLITRADPDLGTTGFGYDALGEYTIKVDPKGQTTTIAYDKLGRRISRSDPTQTSTWTYDTAPHGIGKLASATSSSGPTQSYSYDAFGRAASETQAIDGTAYTYAITYDSAGRKSSLAYPAGFGVTYVYTSSGFMSEIHDASTNALIWKSVAEDGVGPIETELGNGTGASFAFDPNHRYATMAATRDSDHAVLEQFTYAYDLAGNLASRSDSSTGLSESFTHDALNRLTDVNGSYPKHIQYDAIGNIQNKSDVYPYTPGSGAGPAYVYDSLKPHAVHQIGSQAPFTYDENGNMIAGAQRTVSLTAFDLPSSIQMGSVSYSWTYDADRARVKMVNAGVSTKIYIRPQGQSIAFEKTTYASGLVEQKNLVFALGKPVAQYTQRSSGTNDMRYLYVDHLGSISLVLDESGNVVERLSYDAFGKRRYPNGADDPSNSLGSATTVYGFTGHEELDGLHLVHMNGRLFDPYIGRFVSADPHLQDKTAPQNLNRYSYVVNRPLVLTDPTGYDGSDSGGKGDGGDGGEGGTSHDQSTNHNQEQGGGGDDSQRGPNGEEVRKEPPVDVEGHRLPPEVPIAIFGRPGMFMNVCSHGGCGDGGGGGGGGRTPSVPPATTPQPCSNPFARPSNVVAGSMGAFGAAGAVSGAVAGPIIVGPELVHMGAFWGTITISDAVASGAIAGATVGIGVGALVGVVGGVGLYLITRPSTSTPSGTTPSGSTPSASTSNPFARPATPPSGAGGCS